MSEITTSIVTVLLAIVGVAVIAVLVSKNANTSGVIGAGSQGFSSGLGAALSPVTGSGFGLSSFGMSGVAPGF